MPKSDLNPEYIIPMYRLYLFLTGQKAAPANRRKKAF